MILTIESWQLDLDKKNDEKQLQSIQNLQNFKINCPFSFKANFIEKVYRGRKVDDVHKWW